MKAIRIMAFKPARTHGRGLQPGSGKRAFVRLHELDADPVAFFPGYLAGSTGRSPIELQLELGLDELLVVNPEACAAIGDRREAGSRSTWMKEQSNQKDHRQRKAGQHKKSLFQRSHPALPPGSNHRTRVWFRTARGACCCPGFLAARAIWRIAHSTMTTEASVALARDNVLRVITAVVTCA